MKDFKKTISQNLLNIENKNRSNLFAWRGQFSPQLIEYLIKAYCPSGSIILDPFAGSGTVLFEAVRMGLSAFGFEINPSAWSFSKLYEFANISYELREEVILELRSQIQAEFPIVIFSETEILPKEVEQRVIRIGSSISDKAQILCNALVVLLDIFNNQISGGLVQRKFSVLVELIRSLPYSEGLIKADLQDARRLQLENHSIDFVITSPPYINVFNYHQNYRRSVELLGWDVLRVARSEIGSNRANRGNRFYTVIQYCIDMANTLQELARILKPGGRAIIIIGYESKVLGVSFNNADIVERIALDLGMYDLVLRQKRTFKNRFGKEIREDILNLTRTNHISGIELTTTVGQNVALASFETAIAKVSPNNGIYLTHAINRIRSIYGTPIFDSTSYSNYQTRESIMMVKEEEER